jgi:hypothetical protein
MEALQNPDPAMVSMTGSPATAWESVLANAPNLRTEDMATAPKVFVTAARSADLPRQLNGLHLGQGLVHLGIDRTSDFTAPG